VQERGQRSFVEPFDAAAPEAGEVVDRLADHLGGIGVLVNVAGTGHRGLALDLPAETWRHTLATDLDGPFLCSRTAARRMVAAGGGGRIINVTSVHEQVPRLGAAAYCAAKAGLGMLTKVLALELAEHGITVNAVAPGFIETDMTKDMLADVVKAIPARRAGQPDEVGAAVRFLASDDAAYVTGTTLFVDGGMSA